MNSDIKSLLQRSRFSDLYWIFPLMLLILTSPAHAYIGPGAGFALLSSLFTLFLSFLIAFFSLLFLPLRLLFSFLQSGKGYASAKVKRIVILGFDGLDPDLCEDFMQQGLLPHFAKLKQTGSFKRLRTTCPPLSPVAWSSFATGVNPAKHRIFDFLHRNPNTYLPELSSVKTSKPNKYLRMGTVQIPLGRSRVKILQKSRPFWKILGQHGIFSQIIRVPITFPPEKFNGHLLSAMCTPDLLGTQGSFTFYSSDKNHIETFTSGAGLLLEKNQTDYKGFFIGPENSFLKGWPSITLGFDLFVEKDGAVIETNHRKYRIKKGRLTPWIPLTFRTGFGLKIHGICQMLLKTTEPAIQLYVSPIHIHPERPAMPISYPCYYAVYLAKLYGSYATLGLAEDTWALNEGILGEDDFLDQVYQYQKEREQQLFHILKKNRRGLAACVFDAADRIQHAFFRYIDETHPAFKNGNRRSKNAIRDVYQVMDGVLGRVLKVVRQDTLLLVLSDHGFKSFRRGINVNSWLHQNGYLFLKENKNKNSYLQNVDWCKTTAYAIGLAGIYINRKGREKQGIVETENVEPLKKKLVKDLVGLTDPETNESAIRAVYNFEQINQGPYASEAPDLIVGYNPGYRISWDGAIGITTETVFEDNVKSWSGDHGIDPEQVPGVLFSNYKIQEHSPHIMDIAPTILSLFGIKKPEYMDGRELHMFN
ncbi:nucleotide pyrophosphatase [candidate division KSB1 bacterium]|nr:alkaline phosphatase family protein [candidate division KSB1 bacterium]RQW06978.1 MAG: nucleotide pyrophosphatase [candidate division KSB1 bacterium]